MFVTLEELVRSLDLEPVSANEWEGRSPEPDVPHLLGGHVVAQALAAAQRSLEGATARSMHATFLSRGSAALPIRFETNRLRTGRSVSTETVTARQGDDVLLHATVSFHREEPGPAHRVAMDDVGPPEGELWEVALQRAVDRVDDYELINRELPLEIRGVGGIGLFRDETGPPQARCWVRGRGRLPDDPLVHQCLFAYASDYVMMLPVSNPLPVSVPALRTTSLDHAIWFHDDFRMDDWVLFELDSPVCRGGRGLGRGLLYTREGELVASCVQEGLVRTGV